MSYNKYRSTGGALSYDAYYSDEFGLVNDQTNTNLNKTQRIRFHKNRFTDVINQNSTILEKPKSIIAGPIENKANPIFNNNLKIKQTSAPSDRTKDTHLIPVYFSNSVISYWQNLKGRDWLLPINFTILYAVGTELNRHGIRSIFENKTNNQAIILVPGIEIRKKGDVRWGVGIGTDQIENILHNFFNISSNKKIPYKIKVLAAFSTGYNGLNQTLLNELVSLDEVERLIYYDCLYEFGSGSTIEAINKLKNKTGSKLKIIVYKTSESGNSYLPDNRYRLSVISKNYGLIDQSGIIENLFQQPNYISLICFRVLEAAERDQVITIPTQLRQAYDNMKKIIPSRGTIISNRSCYQFVYGNKSNLSNKILYEDWRIKNQSILTSIYHFIGSKDISTTIKAKINQGSIRDLIWNNELPGWPGGDGEEKHDLLLPEFAWEFLPWDEPSGRP